MATRQEVYFAIDSERDYQDAQKGNSARHTDAPAVMPPGEALTYIRKIVRDAEEAAYRGSTGAMDSIQFFRKLAAVAVRVMEDHGAPVRIA
jgi:hypothetical protein